MLSKRPKHQLTRYPISSLLIAVALVLCPNTSLSQEQTQTPSSQVGEDGSEIACGLRRLEMVILHVAISDSTAAPVSGLTHNDFVIYEDGIKQNVAYFEEADEPGTGRTGYRIFYYPTNVKRDGEYRIIRVRVPTNNGQQLRVRPRPKGYFAPIDF